MTEHEVGPWQFDLEAYIREAEPNKAQRADAWQTAIGLQAVDGLKTSDYLLSTAVEHIEGRISIDAAQRRILEYYHSRDERSDKELADTEEGDIVSSRIARLLGERAFILSPVQLKTIHRTLFEGLLAEAGEYRTYNITKREWVLNGDTVLYAPADTIAPTLEYDFGQERSYSYRGRGKVAALRHVESFISGLWQIHPFCEGNTRTTAVFAIKYLASLGYRVDNEPFKRNSWYFRNALVRANYEDLERGVHPTGDYLDLFFDNLLLGNSHELKNRYLHVDWEGRHGHPSQGIDAQVGGKVGSKAGGKPSNKVSNKPSNKVGNTGSDTGHKLVLSETQQRVLDAIRDNPHATRAQLGAQLSLGQSSVYEAIRYLRNNGIIERVGSKKTGWWRVLS